MLHIIKSIPASSYAVRVQSIEYSRNRSKIDWNNRRIIPKTRITENQPIGMQLELCRNWNVFFFFTISQPTVSYPLIASSGHKRSFFLYLMAIIIVNTLLTY